MHTNIELDESLIKQALKISGLKAKKDIVNEALKQYVAIMNHPAAELRGIAGLILG